MIKFNQKGYVIQAVLIVFAVLIGIMVFPIKFPSQEAGSGKCAAGEPPTDQRIIQLPEPTHDQATYFEGTDEYIRWGIPNQNNMVDYVPIRANVMTPNESRPPYWRLLGAVGPIADYNHTYKIGEDPQKPGFDLYYPTQVGEIDIPGGTTTLNNAGLVFFVNRDPATVKEINGKTVYSIDVYQKKTVYEDPAKTYVTEELFPCSPDSPEESPAINVSVPAQNVSPAKDQLQLEWFLFERKGGIWGIHCKPAVYLYPKAKQLVNVKVFPKGELTYTDPPYNVAKGWTVEAHPDGGLFNLPEKSAIGAGYLYYESRILDSEIKKPAEGWVVKKDELSNLFNNTLPKLGLNKKEQKDFSDYWLKQLPDSPYYFVGLIKKEQRDYLERIIITPNPDTSIRFSFFFEPLERPIFVEEPVIKTPERTGFTLVDWGGMIKLHEDTPFTCSQ